jgi:hypothetical protein
MTREPPSLAQQIEAVERAVVVLVFQESVWPPALRDDAVEDMRLCLLAALDTLKTMEFARATLK